MHAHANRGCMDLIPVVNDAILHSIAGLTDRTGLRVPRIKQSIQGSKGIEISDGHG